MGKHEQLEVVVAERQLLEARQRVLERSRLIGAAQRECGHAAQRHLRDHAERPERDASGAKCVGVEQLGAAQRAAIGEDQRKLGQLGRDVAQARPGAVRGGGNRAGDRLRVDIAEVLQRQSVAGQQAVQLTDRDAGLDAHEPGRVIDVEDALAAVEPQLNAVGQGDVAERVSRPGDADSMPARRGPPIASPMSATEPGVSKPAGTHT